MSNQAAPWFNDGMSGEIRNEMVLQDLTDHFARPLHENN
jgi:hypothetical protein